LNENFDRKREKKRERRKKKEEKKKMIKKLSKLADGVNKYTNLNGNYIEEFQKEVENNPEILAKPEEHDKNNFDEFDYKLDVPKEVKKGLKKEEEIIEKPKMEDPVYEDDEEYEDEEEDDSYLEEEVKVEVETIPEVVEVAKIKVLPKNLIIYDNDL
jgi:hypothetical protein